MKQQIKPLIFLIACLILASCSTTRKLKPGQYLYTGAKIIINPDSSKKIEDQKFVKTTLEKRTRPRPNKSFLGVKWKLLIHNLAADTVKPKGIGNWLKNKIGEKPVLLSEVRIKYNNDVLKSYLISQGYLQAEVTGDTVIKGKKGSATYTAITGDRYKIKSISFPKDTGTLTRNINQNIDKTLIKVNNFYDLDTYKNERVRIDNDLKESGYFYFSPDYLILQIDSTIGKNMVDVNVAIKNTSPDAGLKPYTIKNINIYPSYNLRRDSVLRSLTPLKYNDFNIYDNKKTFKPRMFDRLVFFKKGELYNRKDHNQSLNRMVNIGAFQDVRAEFLPIDSFRNNQLDLNIYLTPLKKNSLSFSVIGTNKSNNFIGSEVKIMQTTRNLFRGGEILQVSASGGFESQYSGQNSGISSFSFTTESRLTFNQFIVPFFKPKSTTAFIPKTVVALSFQLLSRDTLYKLNSFKGEFGYIWKENIKKEHKLNPISINYVKPTGDPAKIAAQILKTPGLRNTLEKQFIIGSNYNFTFTNQMEDSRRNTTYFNAGLETSGNITGLFVSKNSLNEKTIFNTPLNQFVRLETDLRDYYKINRNVIWANRLNLGYGYAYGNSTTLPFVKQFFGGGSNDVRAFRARSLGPGTYQDVSTNSTFSDQGGDIKLLINSELRFKLVSILYGAAFVDAGNIWLRKEDPTKPGSGFKFSNALNEIAVGTGVGLRVDAKIFVVRLDGAFPLRKPYLPKGNRWVLNQVDFGSKAWRKENFILNIGIGYPF